MTDIPKGLNWGANHRVRGRRMHIVDWEGTVAMGFPVGWCGMEIDNTSWSDDEWDLQEEYQDANPARPCPHCIKEYKNKMRELKEYQSDTDDGTTTES